MAAESEVLAAIAELEREDAEEHRPWFEAPERAFRRGARMEVAPPPLELMDEVRGHGAFPDAVETHYERAVEYSGPSFRSLVPPPLEEEDVRRMREWSERTVRLSRELRMHVFGQSEVVLLPNEYPTMQMVFGMPVRHVPIRGGYVGFRFDGTFAGMASAMDTYWTLERAPGEPWILAGRELLRSAARSDRVFLPVARASIRRDWTSTSSEVPMPRSFSELEQMRLLGLPSDGDIFVGYSMILPLISDMERELERQRNARTRW
jgi:hypothetical protein